MNIELTQSGIDSWQADMTDLPGSPPIGRGKTAVDALVVLFFHVFVVDMQPDWKKYVRRDRWSLNIHSLENERKERMNLGIGDVIVASGTVHGYEIVLQILDIRLADDDVLVDVRRSVTSPPIIVDIQKPAEGREWVDEITVKLENLKHWLDGRQWYKRPQE